MKPGFEAGWVAARRRGGGCLPFPHSMETAPVGQFWTQSQQEVQLSGRITAICWFLISKTSSGQTSKQNWLFSQVSRSIVTSTMASLLVQW